MNRRFFAREKQLPIKRKAFHWQMLPTEQLLDVRICNLHLKIAGTPLESRIKRLYRELDKKNIRFHPPCYLADEWFCPDGVPIIGIPFYLAHPRLYGLERKMMLEVEGGTEQWCMQLLRHETGHALNYAYRLYRKPRWREIFGPFETRYPGTGPRKPYSRSFVNHLADNYAQAHPDEDFAETFAVWLTPDSCWRERYRSWPALRKLLYIDRLIKGIRDKPPIVRKTETPWSASRMKMTLASYYKKKRRDLRHEFPGFFDPSLRRLFPVKPLPGISASPAAQFLDRRRKRLVNSVALWTGHRKFDIDKTIKLLTIRCDDLDLFIDKQEDECIADTAAFITAAMGNIHGFRRKFECQ